MHVATHMVKYINKSVILNTNSSSTSSSKFDLNGQGKIFDEWHLPNTKAIRSLSHCLI